MVSTHLGPHTKATSPWQQVAELFTIIATQVDTSNMKTYFL